MTLQLLRVADNEASRSAVTDDLRLVQIIHVSGCSEEISFMSLLSDHCQWSEPGTCALKVKSYGSSEMFLTFQPHTIYLVEMSLVQGMMLTRVFAELWGLAADNRRSGAWWRTGENIILLSLNAKSFWQRVMDISDFKVISEHIPMSSCAWQHLVFVKVF